MESKKTQSEDPIDPEFYFSDDDDSGDDQDQDQDQGSNGEEIQSKSKETLEVDKEIPVKEKSIFSSSVLPLVATDQPPDFDPDEFFALEEQTFGGSPGSTTENNVEMEYMEEQSPGNSHHNDNDIDIDKNNGRTKNGDDLEANDNIMDEDENENENDVDGFVGVGSKNVENSGPQVLLWGTNIPFEEVKTSFLNFFETYCRPGTVDPLYPVLLQQMHKKGESNINIDCSNLFDFNPTLYRQLIMYPSHVIPICDLAIHEIFAEMFDIVAEDLEERIQVRFFGLREIKSMRDLAPSDIDKLVAIRGMITRATPIIPNMQQGFFQCVLCNNDAAVDVDLEEHVQEPTFCSRCHSRGSMTIVHNRCIFSDKQVVKIQETPESIPEGETPQTAALFAFDKLVDVAKPGDRVEITGIFRATPGRASVNRRVMKSLYRTYFDVIHFKKTEKHRLAVEDAGVSDTSAEFYTPFDEMDTPDIQNEENIQRIKELSKRNDIYELLSQSLAPSIWELQDVKKGLLCLLFGGTNKEFKFRGGRFRGEVNVLLVGDPGTSKSQLLSFVHKIAPRGVYTSGKGSSAVGLTAYITRDPDTGENVLESGALVLSDRGVCCIDEFDKMSDSSRPILHEAMEQQTVSVAKAGIICSLNARTSILACANPKESRYNPRLSVVDNVQLPPTLLSRFDLIYLVLDKPNEISDGRLARHLISLYWGTQKRSSEIMSLELLAKYISYAKQHCHPKISDDARTELIRGYIEMRRIGTEGGRKTITATPRQLESLIRLSEALAKMRLDSIVKREDVREAWRLVRVALQHAAVDPKTGTIDMDLITTGRSAADRVRVNNMKGEVFALLNEFSQKTSVSEWGFPRVLEAVREKNDANIGSEELREVLFHLVQEGTIEASPNYRTIKLVKII